MHIFPTRTDQEKLQIFLRYPKKKFVSKSGLILLYYINCSARGELHWQGWYEIIETTGKPHYQRAHEWCCGHGAYGFELLYGNKCDTLLLTDIFEPALISCEFTAALNDLSDRVEVVRSFDFSDIDLNEKWDLLVCDPPNGIFNEIRSDQDINADGIRQTQDLNFQLHQNFFANVMKHLAPDADVYFGCFEPNGMTEKIIAMAQNVGFDLISKHTNRYFTYQTVLHLKEKIDRI